MLLPWFSLDAGVLAAAFEPVLGEIDGFARHYLDRQDLIGGYVDQFDGMRRYPHGTYAVITERATTSRSSSRQPSPRS